MKNLIKFYKMSGSGNDFIVIDDRNHVLKEVPIKTFSRKICQRGLSVGADGLILIQKSALADFKWRYFNADGEEASFCGNGARCAARFAVLKKIAGPVLTFEAHKEIISAQVKKKTVRVKMMKGQKIRYHADVLLDQKNWEGHFIVMGVPHWIHFSKDLDAIDISNVGSRIRSHAFFQPEGTNVNFVDILNDHEIRIRTYERGVEAETLACGTGTVASALIGHEVHRLQSPVTVYPKGQIPLKVFFKKKAGEFSDIYLEGDARVIFEGVLSQEAWQY